jgi:hypothetical protein
VLLTGPFAGLTDDVREFLRCLADEACPSPAGGTSTRPACARSGSGCPGAAPAATARTAWPWPGGGPPCCGRCATPAGSPRPRPGCSSDTLLQELAGLPPGQVELAGVARRFRALTGHHWPSMLAAADPDEWRQALWSTALAPLAMLGAINIPARIAPNPAWFALTGTAPALVAAAAAMTGPEPPPSLASATQN